MASDPFEQPAGRAPAPGALAVVQAFVNTYMNLLDEEGGVEHLSRPGDLQRFLVAHGLLAPHARVTGAELAAAVSVREALRRLAAANNGAPLDASALATLDAAADAAGLTLRLGARDRHGALTAASPRVAGALGRLLALVQVAMVEETWPRLKACAHPRCHWLFYDRSNNRSSRWCSMAVCGSRAKMQAHRRRRAGA